ncbi:hypothetical protein Tco_0967113 [Tanacetum coccineum]
MEVSRLSGMDTDLFTYKVEVANIPFNSVMDDDLVNETDNDIGYDPSDIRGDDRVELTGEESFDDEDEIAEVFRIDTNIFDYETPICSAFNEFNYLLKSRNQSNILASLITIKLGVRNGQQEALRNKAIMDGVINNDESCCKLKRKWNIYTNYDDAYEINHEDNRNKELCEIHEPPVCNIRKYMMIEYLFNDDEEYVVVKEDEYDDLIMTRRDACQAYQDIF